jgi:uncharacterized membrane protein YdbT with pleckstrin-like domain
MKNTKNPFSKEMLIWRPSWRSYFVFYAAILIFGLGPALNPEAGVNRTLGLFIAVFLLLYILLRRKHTYYRLGADGAVKETGLWGKTTVKALALSEIGGVLVRRGVVHRLLGIGHLQIRSSRSERPDLWWYGLEDPFTVARKIEEFRMQRETAGRSD